MSDVCTAATLAYTFSAEQGYEEGGLHDRISSAASPVLLRKWKDMPSLPMGGDPKEWKRANKRRLREIKEQVRQEIYPQFKDEPVGFFFATFGIFWLLQVVIGSFISWVIHRWLDQHYRVQVLEAIESLRP